MFVYTYESTRNSGSRACAGSKLFLCFTAEMPHEFASVQFSCDVIEWLRKGTHSKLHLDERQCLLYRSAQS